MKSSLSAFSEGTTGPSLHPHEPIFRTEDGADPTRSRIIVRDGEFTPEATDHDRELFAAKLPPPAPPAPEPPPQPEAAPEPAPVFKESAMLRSWAADVVQRKHRGRPGRLAHYKPEIEKLRGEGLSWAEVGARLSVHPDAARAVAGRAAAADQRRSE